MFVLKKTKTTKFKTGSFKAVAVDDNVVVLSILSVQSIAAKGKLTSLVILDFSLRNVVMYVYCAILFFPVRLHTPTHFLTINIEYILH